MATIDKNFRIKNGLTVGDVEIVSSTGEWVGPSSGLVGPPGVDGANGADGLDGEPGDSAYQVALNNGFIGSELDWLASLQGVDGVDGMNGDPGEPGVPGVPGANGLSAYQIAVNNGFVGTEAQWLNTLSGYAISVVSALPGSPDSNTIYFVTG